MISGEAGHRRDQAGNGTAEAKNGAAPASPAGAPDRSPRYDQALQIIKSILIIQQGDLCDELEITDFCDGCKHEVFCRHLDRLDRLMEGK